MHKARATGPLNAMSWWNIISNIGIPVLAQQLESQQVALIFPSILWSN